MRVLNPNGDGPYEDNAIETANEVLGYEENVGETLVDYLVKMDEETSYVPENRQRALGAMNVMLRTESSYWVNPVAILEDISDEEYDEIIRTLFDWKNWD